MNIYILPTAEQFRPNPPFAYPHHNRDFGIEPDFHQFLQSGQVRLVTDPAQADWHYLPIYWTAWHLQHNYAETGREELQAALDKALIDPKRTFTICQYDDGLVVDGRGMHVFLGSRKTSAGLDVPLLSLPHAQPWGAGLWRRYRASFVGRIGTHPLRQAMQAALASRRDVRIYDGDIGTRRYLWAMLGAEIALCPRGYGGSSFRFFEAMQLGRVPLLLGDIDVRPFKTQIDWDAISLYTSDPLEVPQLLDRFSIHELRHMGKRTAQVYHQKFSQQRWCSLVLNELRQLA